MGTELFDQDARVYTPSLFPPDEVKLELSLYISSAGDVKGGWAITQGADYSDLVAMVVKPRVRNGRVTQESKLILSEALGEAIDVLAGQHMNQADPF